MHKYFHHFRNNNNNNRRLPAMEDANMLNLSKPPHHYELLYGHEFLIVVLENMHAGVSGCRQPAFAV